MLKQSLLQAWCTMREDLVVQTTGSTKCIMAHMDLLRDLKPGKQ